MLSPWAVTVAFTLASSSAIIGRTISTVTLRPSSGTPFGADHPLPDLRAGDLGGGGVFHQVVDGHAAVAGQPGAEVVDADVDVVAQAGFGDQGWAAEVQPLRTELPSTCFSNWLGLSPSTLTNSSMAMGTRPG